MVLTFIAICLLTTPISECNRATAIDWFESEPQASVLACMRHGEMAVSRRQLIDNSTYLKIFCSMPMPAKIPDRVG